jgi:hypothetical protein
MRPCAKSATIVSRSRIHFPSVVLLREEGLSVIAPCSPRQRHFQRLQLAGVVESFVFVQSGPKPREIEVVDEDLGRSAAGTVTRAGFERMVAEVSLGKVRAVAPVASLFAP